MADNVFRVEVGAKIGASTATLKKDIQGILDKMPARKIEVSLNTAKTRQNIKAELDKLKGKYSIPVELSAKGTGLNGTSGKNFKAALKIITNEINAQQAAKVTLHVDTAATQKAMLAELKKLNLGVTITPGNGNNGGGKQVDEYVKAWKQVAQLQASANAKFAKSVPLDATSNQYQALQAQGQRIMQQAQQIRDAYLQTADAQQRGITQANFDAMVAGNKKVQDSIDKLTEAQAKYNDAQAKAQQTAKQRTGKIDEKYLDQSRDLSANVDKLKQKLNQSVPVAAQYSQQLDMLEDAYYAGAIDIDQYNQALDRWKTAAGKAGAMAESAGQKFSRMLGDKIGYGAIALVLMKIRQALGQVYTNVVNLDTAMTELKKVTDETDATYQKFLTNAASRARALGATITDTVNATASFARLGYGIEDASKLADAAVVYKHVGDEVESIDEASNSVISTMQAFGVEASNVMSIVDKFNQIGNEFAISSGGVGEAMQRSAAAMQAAGNTIDETLALIAAMNTVVQNPESVGTTLKTVSMYLRAAKTEAEAAGESTDGMADSVSKLRDEIKSLTGNKVDIMLDEDTFKSSYQILKELSQVWDQLSDVSQANILEKLAGKRNANALVAVINNFDIAEQALKESQDAAGSALQENEKYLDSINGKLDQLKASWEQLSNSLLSNGVVKGLIDALRTVLDFFNRLDEATGGWSSRLIAFFAVVGMVNAVISSFKFKAKDATSLLGTFVQAFSKGNILSAFGSALTSVGAKLTVVSDAFKMAANAGAKQFLPTLWTLLPALGQTVLIIGGVVAAIAAVTAAYQAYRKANPTFEDLQKSTEELKQETDQLADSIETANTRIQELQELADNGTISIVEQDELDRLKAQNALLEAQLDVKKELLQTETGNLQDKAIEKYRDFTSADVGYTNSKGEFVSTSDMDTLNGQIDNRLQLNRDLNAALLAGDDQLIARVREKISKNDSYIEHNLATLEEIISAIDFTPNPQNEKQKEMNEIYKQYYMLLDKITYSSGEASAAQTIFNRSLQAPQNAEAIAAIKQLGESSELTKENLLDLYKTNPQVEEYLTNLAKFGVGSLGNFDTFVQLFADAPQAVQDTAVSFQDLMSSLEGLVDKYDALTSAQKEFDQDGKVSASTLSSLIEKFGDLGAEQVALYNAGIIDANQLFSALRSGYQSDVDAYRTALADKLSRSDQFFNVFLQKNATLVNELAKAYGEDVKNAKNAEQLKEKIRASALENWTKNYGQALHSMNVTENSLLVLAYEDNATTPAQKARQAAAKQAIEQLRSYEKQIDSFTYSYTDFDASKFSSKNDKSSSKSGNKEDLHKKAAEEAIAKLKHDYQIEKITAEQYYDGLEAIENQYYKNSTANRKTYASEIRSIDEELFSGRRQLAEDWLSYQEKLSDKASTGGDYAGQQKILNSMLDKVKQMISAAYAYGLTEASDYVQELQDKLSTLQDDLLSAVQSPYEKYISYMDDFDLWDDMSKGAESAAQATSKMADGVGASTEEWQKLRDEMNAAADEWNAMNNGNIDYHKRKVLSGQDMINAGWNRPNDLEILDGATGVTTFTQGWYGKDFNETPQKNRNLYVEVTPILDDGTILSPDSLADYVYEIFQASDVLAADKIENGGYGLIASIWDNPSDKELDDYFDKLDDVKNQHLDAYLELVKQSGSAFASMADGGDHAANSVAKLSKRLRGLSKLDVLKQQLKEIDQLYKDGKLSWEKYVDAHNSVAKNIYDTQRDSLETILDLTIEMIKQEAEDQVDAIEKQEKAYQKIIDLKKQLLQDTTDEEDHEEQVAEKVKEIADLQSKIAQLSLDDSREAAAKRASLAEELQQKQKELADLQKDYALDQTIDTLDKSQEAFEDEKDAEKDAAKESVDSWQKLYEKAIKRINGDWDGLYKDLMKYEKEHRDSIDGPDSLVSAWQSATSAMKEYNNNFEDAYKNAPNDALNPNAPNSAGAQSILEQMQSNSAYALLHPGSGLSKKNAQLAEEYYQQTGQKLYYNSSIGWVKDSPTSTTAAYEILGSNAKANPYSAGTAKYRDTNSSSVKWIQYQLKAAGYPQPIDGNYWDTTAKNVAAFANKYKLKSNNGKEVTPSILKYLKAYHTGGIVGDGGELNDHEVLAILKKGEWVLDDTRKQNLKAMFANLKIAASGLMSSAVISRMQTLRPAAVTSGGDTFAPHIEVSIQHNGQMTDKDAKQYGNMVANTALEQLRTAFAKRGKV